MRALPGILLAALATLASSAASLHVHIALFPVLEVASEDSSRRQPAKMPHYCRSSSNITVNIPNRPKEEANWRAGVSQDDLYHQEARGTIGLVTRMRTLEDYQVDLTILQETEHFLLASILKKEIISCAWEKNCKIFWKFEFCTHALNDSNLSWWKTLLWLNKKL